MHEVPTNNEYLLRAILEIIEKSKTLDEVRESVKKILNEGK